MKRRDGSAAEGRLHGSESWDGPARPRVMARPRMIDGSATAMPPHGGSSPGRLRACRGCPLSPAVAASESLADRSLQIRGQLVPVACVVVGIATGRVSGAPPNSTSSGLERGLDSES
jgi:hypothetical protein